MAKRETLAAGYTTIDADSEFADGYAHGSRSYYETIHQFPRPLTSEALGRLLLDHLHDTRTGAPALPLGYQCTRKPGLSNCVLKRGRVSTQLPQPHSPLRRQRLLRGWSLQQVVKELCFLCQEDEEVPGVTADMVSKWERGVRKPSRFYQTKLCLLYQTTADHLGFLEGTALQEPPRWNLGFVWLAGHPVCKPSGVLLPQLAYSRTRSRRGIEKREHRDMSNTLRIADTLSVNPLIDIQHPAFADTYRRGLWWALYGDYDKKKPLSDSYLIDNLKRDASRGLL